MDKQQLKEKILNEIEDTFNAWVVYPHHGMVPDYFLRYWDLAEAVSEYFDEPFYKPKLSSPDQVK